VAITPKSKPIFIMFYKREKIIECR